MLRIAVMVSGGGTNLQAIIDQVASGDITNTEIAVVISNNKNAYALERARKHGIEARCIAPKDYETRAEFNQVLIDTVDSFEIDLIVLAGCLVVLPKEMTMRYTNRIINIHPSLIPAFCGKGFYGLKVHEEVLKRGVKVTGATCHFVDDGTDTGPIILQQAVMVKQDDTAKELQMRVMKEAEWKIMPEAINLIANQRIQVIENKVIIQE